MKNISFGEVKILKHPMLPVTQCYDACDIATKNEISVVSDEKIHAFEMNGKVYMSDSLYEKTKKLYSETT